MTKFTHTGLSFIILRPLSCADAASVVALNSVSGVDSVTVSRARPIPWPHDDVVVLDHCKHQRPFSRSATTVSKIWAELISSKRIILHRNASVQRTDILKAAAIVIPWWRMTLRCWVCRIPL